MRPSATRVWGLKLQVCEPINIVLWQTYKEIVRLLVDKQRKCNKESEESAKGETVNACKALVSNLTITYS